MRKFLSIFMSLVMVVTMLPKASFAEVDAPNGHKVEECQDESEAPENGNEGQQPDGPFKFLSDNFSLFTNFVKEKAPQVWKKMSPYVDSVKGWGKGYYNNVSRFANEVGKLGVLVTVGLSALVVKVVWKVFKFIVALFDDESKQAVGYTSNSLYSANGGQPNAYPYSNGGYKPPYTHMV